MKELIKRIAQALVDNPKQVSVREINGSPLILYNSCLYITALDRYPTSIHINES